MFEGITSYERLISVGILGNYLENHVFASIAPLAILFVGGFVVTAIVAYLLGSINFGIIISSVKGEDIRTKGSGNAGATNMLRTYGKTAGALTLVGDAMKGALAVMLGRILLGSACGYVAALFALIGHAFPIYYRFKGGKGVAVSIGAIFALNWAIGLVELALFALVVLATKYVSLGSISAAAFLPILVDRFKVLLIPGAGQVPFIAPLIAFVMGAFVIWLHRKNIKRLFAKTEPKLTDKKEKT